MYLPSEVSFHLITFSSLTSIRFCLWLIFSYVEWGKVYLTINHFLFQISIFYCLALSYWQRKHAFCDFYNLHIRTTSKTYFQSTLLINKDLNYFFPKNDFIDSSIFDMYFFQTICCICPGLWDPWNMSFSNFDGDPEICLSMT